MFSHCPIRKASYCYQFTAALSDRSMWLPLRREGLKDWIELSSFSLSGTLSGNLLAAA